MRSYSMDPEILDKVNKIVILSMYKKTIESFANVLPATFFQKKFKTPRLLIMAAIKEIIHTAITVPKYMLRGNKLSFTVKILDNPEFFDFMIYCMYYNTITRCINNPDVTNLFGENSEVTTRTVVNGSLRPKYLYNSSAYLHPDTPKNEFLANISFRDHPLNLNPEDIRTNLNATFVLFDIFKEHYDEIKPTLVYFEKLYVHWNRLQELYYSATSNRYFDETFFQYIDFVLSRQRLWDFERSRNFGTEFSQWREQVRTGNLNPEAIFGPSAIPVPVTEIVRSVEEIFVEEDSINNWAISDIHAGVTDANSASELLQSIFNLENDEEEIETWEPVDEVPFIPYRGLRPTEEDTTFSLIPHNEEREFTMNLVQDTEPENFTLIRRG